MEYWEGWIHGNGRKGNGAGERSGEGRTVKAGGSEVGFKGMRSVRERERRGESA